MNLPEGIIQTPHGHFVLRDDTHLSRWVEERGCLGIELEKVQTWYRRYIPVGGVVINAGASLGDHACLYAQMVGTTGRVYAFEPNPLSFDCLRLNMQKYPQVECINAALGAMVGGAQFIRDANVGASHIIPDRDHNGSSASTVPVTTIDEVFGPFGRQLKHLDFIHLDAEGYEPFILTGASTTISRTRPIISIEVCRGHLARYNCTEKSLDQLFRFHNYAWSEMDGTPESEQRDILALPL